MRTLLLKQIGFLPDFMEFLLNLQQAISIAHNGSLGVVNVLPPSLAGFSVFCV
jgi:hypothetical protein